MNTTELVVFIIYLVFMIGIGVYFFTRSRCPRCPPAHRT